MTREIFPRPHAAANRYIDRQSVSLAAPFPRCNGRGRQRGDGGAAGDKSSTTFLKCRPKNVAAPSGREMEGDAVTYDDMRAHACFMRPPPAILSFAIC